jgi:uncharacterized membrane protein
VTDLGAFLGRFHPLLVHLPIGILLVAGMLEVLARTRRYAGVRPAVGPALVLGAAGAVVSAASGWLLGETGGYGGDTYTWHLRMGIGVAVSAVLTAVAYVAGDPGRPAPHSWGRASALQTAAYPSLLLITLAHVAAAGHLGGTLTHGEGYLTDHAPAFLRPRATADAPAPRVASETVVFDTLVQPVLHTRCVACHGPTSAQGGLRLDSKEGIATGGESGPVLAAGRPEASELLRRIWLPPSHKDAMPPRGRRPVTASEAVLLRWWIEQGASFDGTLADADVPPVVQPAIEAAVGPIDLGAPAILGVHVPSPDPVVVERVAASGVSVARLANGTPFLRVNSANVAARFGDEQLAMLVPLATQVTWLSLGGTRVSDAGLATLARFPNLTRLHLERTAVTDDGLAHLARLQRLEYLNLYGTAVTDAGLRHLTSLTQLRTLYLWQTKTTPAGIERLRAALPRLEVNAGIDEATQAGRKPAAAAAGSRQ